MFEAEKGQAGKALVSLFSKHIEEREKLFDAAKEQDQEMVEDYGESEDKEQSDQPRRKLKRNIDSDGEDEEDLFDDKMKDEEIKKEAASSEDDDLF